MPAGDALPPGGGALADLAGRTCAGLRAPPGGGVTCLTDVTAPLLGPRGAAAVFGPQKGADRAQIARLEAGLARLAEVLGGDPAAPGAGAAGGTGYGLAAAWGATLTPGAAELRPAGGAGPGAGRRRSGHYRGGTVRRDVADREDVRDRDRRRGGGRGAGGGGRGAGERGADSAGARRLRVPALTVVVSLAGLAGGTAAALARPRRWLRAAGGRLASDVGAESSPA